MKVAYGLLGTLLVIWGISEVMVAAKQRQLEQLRADEAAYEAVVVKPRQEALLPSVRRCLEQELTPVYAVNPEYIVVPGARVAAKSFEIIVCVETK
jgi:hypothetical protein